MVMVLNGQSLSEMMHIINLEERTKRGLQEHIRILDVLNAGRDEFGQVAVPNACRLQYEQKRRQ